MSTYAGCQLQQRVDAGGDIQFFRAQHAEHGAVCVVIAPPSTWPPWADPGIFAQLPPDDHVVRVLGSEVGNPDQVDVVVLEWVEGQTLRERLERAGPLSLVDSFDIAQNVCRALMHLQRGIALEDGKQLPCAHGNVHPRWVHITDRGEVKLGGLGLGSLKPEQGEKRWHNLLLAAPPEVLRGEQGDPAVAGDVFGLGAVLHYSLTGRGVYTEKPEPQEMIEHLRSGDPLIASTLPPEARSLLSELLAFAPEERPSLQRASELIAEAREALVRKNL